MKYLKNARCSRCHLRSLKKNAHTYPNIHDDIAYVGINGNKYLKHLKGE
jgi:cytochrome c553